jgi:hypothetical protein
MNEKGIELIGERAALGLSRLHGDQRLLQSPRFYRLLRRCRSILPANAALDRYPTMTLSQARCMEAGTLIMSAGLNALAFTGGAFG